jgi:hypothetical protein
MLTPTTNADARTTPSWLPDVQFCHIDDGSLERAYCGDTSAPGCTCPTYRGEAICPDCGAPTCPRCAQLCALEESLLE